MIDSRGCLPHELAGGHAGLPCARRSYRSPPTKVVNATERVRARFPDPELKRRPATSDCCGEALLAAATPAWRTGPLQELTSSQSLPTLEGRPAEYVEMVPFAGTRTLPFETARARSAGALAEGELLDHVLRKRHTTDLDDLVDILQLAISNDSHGRVDLWSFKQPHNAHRHSMRQDITDEQKRRQVLRTLRIYPICDVYDLARCAPDVWACISRELGGISHGVVMRCAIEYVQTNFTRRQRATFWAAVGLRQQNVNHTRVLYFAGDRRPSD